jgi:hypothetical protein
MLWRILAGLLATLLLTTSANAGGLLYRCAMDGQVHEKRCCCASETDASTDHGPKVERYRGCCSVEVAGAAPLPATSPPGGSLELPPFTAVPVLVEALLELPPRVIEAPAFVRARGPPRRTGPPLFMRNCAFLI